MATILCSSSLDDENSFGGPTKILPRTQKVKEIKKSFEFEFKGYSVTVLRIKTRK